MEPLVAEIERRYAELEAELGDPAVLADQRRYADVAREHKRLSGAAELARRWRELSAQQDEAAELAADGDAEMRAFAQEQVAEARDALPGIEDELRLAMVERDPADDKDVIVELRAGTGGDEAALFAGDLFEMYRKYAEARRWNFIVSDFSPSERGGFKEMIVNIKGNSAYRHLRFEGGGHRVQRVPETETQGRIHTSAATVAVLPELPDVKIEINSKDVEEFGCRGGGPGGQNVNKVETGWFIRHKPSGLQFKMTEHKSQTQNKERAWALLRATLYETERAKQHANLTASRKAMMGSGDRSQRIRTYNFPQNRCTDHRLGGEGSGEKNFNLDQIMTGQLDPLIHALWELDKQQRLEEL